MKITTPQVSMPFRFDENSRLVVNEQDTLDEIADCVEAILRTPLGWFDELPDLGIPDLAFRQLPANHTTLVNAISEWEDRVEVLISEDPDRFNAMVERVRIELRGRTDG